MANTKITKTQRFEQIIALVKDNAELVEFLNHEIELLAKKSARKSAKADTVKDGVKAEILAVLTDKGMTVTEIVLALGNKYTSQKVTPMIYQLIDAGLVTKTVEKGKSLFSKADVADAEIDE